MLVIAKDVNILKNRTQATKRTKRFKNPIIDFFIPWNTNTIIHLPENVNSNLKQETTT